MSPAPRELKPLAARGTSVPRRLADLALLAGCHAATLLVIVPLLLITWHLVRMGGAGVSLEFFTHLPKPVGETGGGMANAIAGTAMLALIAAAIAVPIGVGAGVYLAEFGDGPIGTLVRTTADVLSGVPSIVVGVAAYGLIVVPMHGFSALAG